jgi:predicted SAM-dependent methyltransferase
VTLKQQIGRWIIPRLPVTRFVFDLLRLEAAAFAVRAGNTVLPWRRMRLRNLRRERDVLVNVACGPQVLDGFVNLDLYAAAPDVVRCDTRRAIPLADHAARGIRAEQFFEHLEPREEVPAFLAECLRVLAPGGTLRLVVPDAERYLHAYARGDRTGFEELAVPSPFPADLPTRMDVVNHVFHQWHEHRWGYDFETIAHRLRAAGFDRVERVRYRHSLEPALADDREIHAPYSLYVDATSPTNRT